MEMAVARSCLQFTFRNQMKLFRFKEIFLQHRHIHQGSVVSVLAKTHALPRSHSSCLQNDKIVYSKCPATRTFGTRTSVETAQGGASSLSLSLEGRRVQIPLIWLRDHCRCDVCYNSATFQKNVDSYSLSGELRTQDVQVAGDMLTVMWQDGHVSTYSLSWIGSNFYCASKPVERFLWDGPQMSTQTLPTVEYERHMETDEGLKQTLSNLLKFGFCVIAGAPATETGTETAAKRICFVLETVYGAMHMMTSHVMDHSDTAYTSQALGAHTDTTYYTLPAGIQVFHCLHHDGEGGKTLLVDGFNAAEKLRKTHPAFFDTLVQTVVPHEYIENSSSHLYSLGTVLSVDSVSGQLVNIRFNPYDRAPLRTVSPEDIPQFYASYDALTQIIRDKDSAFWLKLLPGSVLLVDNWRVMHGRSSFTGKRVVSGCYLPRDDWISRARVMGLL